ARQAEPGVAAARLEAAPLPVAGVDAEERRALGVRGALRAVRELAGVAGNAAPLAAVGRAVEARATAELRAHRIALRRAHAPGDGLVAEAADALRAALARLAERRAALVHRSVAVVVLTVADLV